MEQSEVKRWSEEMEYVKDGVLSKFPRLGVSLSRLKMIPNDSVGTAGTDGETIYYSPKFIESLSDEQRVFLLAHEVMHVAFNHILRSKGKDQKLWNVATDSVINQMLKNENLPFIDGGVDMAEAVNKSAEEMYEKLKEEKQKKQEEQQQQDVSQPDVQNEQGQPQGEEGQNFQGDDEQNEQAGHDNHEIWKEAVESAEKQKEETNQGKKILMDRIRDLTKQKAEGEQSLSDYTPGHQERCEQDDSNLEKMFAAENRQERQEQAKAIREALHKRKNELMKGQAENDGYSFGDVGQSDAVLDWKKMLKKSIETEQDSWSYRRSGADNDYMARVEEMEDEDKAETEVMLDVSGSVDVALLKEFLRQLKPILKNSKLKVGCFDEHFYGLKEIKTNEDIDNFKITSRSNWTENWDLAVKSFSKKKEVNKIVFTDGHPCPGTMPTEETRGKNVIWLVYGNRNFNPVCGKVINVIPNQIRQKYTSYTSLPSRSR